MLRVKELQSELRNLVGIDSNDGSLASSLQGSESGLYLTSMHPMLNIPMLRKIAPTEDKTSFVGSAWSKTKRYAEGDVVVYLTVQYRCLVSNKNLPPNANPTYWEEYDAFSAYLGSMRDGSISKMLMRFQSEKITNKASKVLLENKYLFETTGRMQDTIKNTNSMVGLEIIVPRYPSVSTQIKKIGLQMVGTGDVTIYVYHSSRTEPLYEYTFTRTRNGGMQWFDISDLFLSYADSKIDAGGAYYIVYNQDELPEDCVAVNKNWDWSVGPLCTACNKIDFNNYTMWSKLLQITPFKVNPTDDGTLWDISDMSPMYHKSYGLNLQVNITCDLTNFIIDHKLEFADVLSKQMALDMLTSMFYNPYSRINIDTQNGNFNALYSDINGSEMKNKTGLRYELEQAYKAIDIGTRGLDKICLPCANKGLRVKVI